MLFNIDPIVYFLIECVIFGLVFLVFGIITLVKGRFPLLGIKNRIPGFFILIGSIVIIVCATLFYVTFFV